MGAVTILLGLGICVFLIWFFENIANDFAADDSSDTEYVYRRRDTEYAGNHRKTEHTDLYREHLDKNIINNENIYNKQTFAA